MLLSKIHANFICISCLFLWLFIFLKYDDATSFWFILDFPYYEFILLTCVIFSCLSNRYTRRTFSNTFMICLNLDHFDPNLLSNKDTITVKTIKFALSRVSSYDTWYSIYKFKYFYFETGYTIPRKRKITVLSKLKFESRWQKYFEKHTMIGHDKQYILASRFLFHYKIEY